MSSRATVPGTWCAQSRPRGVLRIHVDARGRGVAVSTSNRAVELHTYNTVALSLSAPLVCHSPTAVETYAAPHTSLRNRRRRFGSGAVSVPATPNSSCAGTQEPVQRKANTALNARAKAVQRKFAGDSSTVQNCCTHGRENLEHN